MIARKPIDATNPAACLLYAKPEFGEREVEPTAK